MASINVGEDDFTAVAYAAQIAYDHSDRKTATALDKIARKINAALSNQKAKRLASRSPFHASVQAITWRDVPSVLERE